MSLRTALEQERLWIAQRILKDPELQAKVAGSVASVLDVIGADVTDETVQAVMLAVMPEIAEAVKGWK